MVCVPTAPLANARYSIWKQSGLLKIPSGVLQTPLHLTIKGIMKMITFHYTKRNLRICVIDNKTVFIYSENVSDKQNTFNPAFFTVCLSVYSTAPTVGTIEYISRLVYATHTLSTYECEQER